MFEISNVTKAAEDIKSLAGAIQLDGSTGVRVEIIQNPLSIKVDFLNDDRYKSLIAGFQLIQQVNCCGVLVSTGTYVTKKYRGQGIGQAMMSLKEAIARQYGYSALAATVNITGNPTEEHILLKFGWVKSFSFVNSRTKNTVAFFFKDLNGGVASND